MPNLQFKELPVGYGARRTSNFALIFRNDSPLVAACFDIRANLPEGTIINNHIIIPDYQEEETISKIKSIDHRIIISGTNNRLKNILSHELEKQGYQI